MVKTNEVGSNNRGNRSREYAMGQCEMRPDILHSAQKISDDMRTEMCACCSSLPALSSSVGEENTKKKTGNRE